MKRINQRENTIEQPRVVEQQYVAQLKNAVGQATDILRSGGVLLYPTDTVWGLGCDAANSRAVNKIIQLKGRSQSQSFIVLVHSVEQIERYITQVPEIAYALIEASNAPLTIVYPGAHTSTQQEEGFASKTVVQETVASKSVASKTVVPDGLAPEVIAPDGTVAIRVVRHLFCSALLQKFGGAIVSTSANFTGCPAPATYSTIDPELIGLVDYCVDPLFEASATGKPSSIIKLEVNGEVKILRA